MTTGRKTKPAKPDNTPSAPALNEWGIPDWRDPAAYGDVKQWTYERWRWEFLRRRDNVRRFFDEAVVEWIDNDKQQINQYGYSSAFPGGNKFKPHEPGFRIKLSKQDQEYSGFFSLMNPRIGDQPESVLQQSFWAYDSALSDFFVASEGGLTVRVWLKLHNMLTDDLELKMSDSFLNAMPLEHLTDDDVVIVFSLKRPLKAQLRSAEIELQNAYALKNKPTQRRRHPSKWLGYLRTLDARDAGASWREITAIHPLTANTEQAARDIWEAADALRFNF